MAENLAKVVTPESLQKALAKIIETNPRLSPSTKYDIVYNGKRFPPKEVIRLAAQIQKINDWSSYRLNGGESSSRYLRQKGFEILPKSLATKYYIGGAIWEGDDLTNDFIEGGYWKNGYEDRYIDRIKSVPVGSLIAIKSTYAKSQTKESMLRIKCIGEVIQNPGDGKILMINWEKPFEYFDISGLGSYRGTFSEITDPGDIAAIFNHEDELITEHEKENNIMSHPLNTILYGPPGTGKTYSTITKAVNIINPSLASDVEYDKVKQFFNDQLGDQIEFVTFHTNYSYEDFVQGLRPVTEGHNNQLVFKKQDGIFKQIADRALKNWEDSNGPQQAQMPAFETVFDKYFKPLIEETGTVKVQMETKTHSFEITSYNEDANNLSFVKQSGGTGHNLYIPTLKAYYQEPNIDHTQGLKSYYKPVAKAMLAVANILKTTLVPQERKNYVLIVDEINRANMARVFGELITLLEEDKRWGNENQLRAKLPSGEYLTVPNNLYIIGTMNTADKSIVLLDIALRRRFVFEDMYPREELIDKLIPKPYNEFLKELNKQIFSLKGPDFIVGHAYFIPPKGEGLDFQPLINHKIIPLLTEYFYNNKTNTVYSILQQAIQKVAGYNILRDDYLGVTCKRIV